MVVIQSKIFPSKTNKLSAICGYILKEIECVGQIVWTECLTFLSFYNLSKSKKQK